MANQSAKKAASKAAKKTTATKAVKKTATKKTAAKEAPAPVAVKKEPIKKTARKAPVKKTARKATPRKPKLPAKPLTTVVARVDVGFGNSLYLRGEGAGLSWEKGIVMGCAGSDEWVWSSDAVEAPLEFKVLINDETWADGPNCSVEPGERVLVEPSF